DLGPGGGTALLHRTFVVPPGKTALRFTAAALRPDGVGAGLRLDIVLEDAGGRAVPKRMRTPDGWQTVTGLHPPRDGRQREYLWPLAGHEGKRLRITLIDEDDRRDCHLVCGGFRLTTLDAVNAADFAAHMRRLQKSHRLGPMKRLDSKHFVAIGNAPEADPDPRPGARGGLYPLVFTPLRPP